MSTAAGLMTGYKYDLSSRSVRCLLFDAGDNRWQFVHRLFFIVVPCAAGLVGLPLSAIRPAAHGSRDEVVSVADRCTDSFPKA